MDTQHEINNMPSTLLEDHAGDSQQYEENSHEAPLISQAGYESQTANMETDTTNHHINNFDKSYGFTTHKTKSLEDFFETFCFCSL